MSAGIDIDITSDGRTVWVNTSAGCIGRFGKAGIDIHRSMNDQAAKGECLFCTHGPTTKQDWTTFVEKMNEFYGVLVGPEHMPDRFRNVGSHP